jgi:membrane protein DedA with SNARE-associated domain
VDIQLSLGLWLYFSLSPLPHVFWDNVHAGLTRPVVRFFGIEHITGMLSAIVLLHIGRVWSRRATSDSQRHRRVWIATLAAALIVLISIPWPWMKYGRPLLRLPG